MRKHPSVIVLAALAALVFLAGAVTPAAADAKRFRAFVYPDRTKPDLSVTVDDFRINETIWDEGGVQYVWVRGATGNFKLPFSHIRQIEVQSCLGPDTSRQDWVWYDVLVTGTAEGESYRGRLEIRVMRGVVDGVPWYQYPATERDRGTRLWRIVVGDERIPPTIPWEAPKPAETPVRVPVEMSKPAAPPAPKPLTLEEIFAGLSLDDLNKQAPLQDVFFDFDKAELRPDGELALQKNVAWLKQWASVKLRVEGCADPRGTNEYNLTLGKQRADAVQAYLTTQGVKVDRVEAVSVGKSPEHLVCTEQTEACWARNRRGHFVITAK
jgi:outer membrane protein OmpA-like peptidoglycan-associated protein